MSMAEGLGTHGELSSQTCHIIKEGFLLATDFLRGPRVFLPAAFLLAGCYMIL